MREISVLVTEDAMLRPVLVVEFAVVAFFGLFGMCFDALDCVSWLATTGDEGVAAGVARKCNSSPVGVVTDAPSVATLVADCVLLALLSPQ